MQWESKITLYRFFKSGLFKKFDTMQACASKLFGIQSQVFNSSSLSFFLRTANITYDDIFNALFEQHTLVRIWGQRTTIHIYDPNDWKSITTFLLHQKSWFRSYMDKKGIDTDEILRQTSKLTSQLTIFNRKDLEQLGVDKQYLGSWGDILIELSNSGHICHWKSSEGNGFFANRSFIYPNLLWEEIEYEHAIKNIVRSYFNTYGPATKYDLAHWLGVSITIASEFMQILADELVEVCKSNSGYFLLSCDFSGYEQFDALIKKENYHKQCIVLGKFDPLLVAYHDKTWIVDSHFIKNVWRQAGHVEALIVYNARAVATWRYTIKGKKISFNVSQLEEVAKHKEIIENKFREIAKFFDKQVDSISYIKEDLT